MGSGREAGPFTFGGVRTGLATPYSRLVLVVFGLPLELLGEIGDELVRAGE